MGLASHDQVKQGVAAEGYAGRQAALLAHHGTRARSEFHDLPSPRLRAHVLVAGEGEPAVLVHGGNSAAALMEPLLGDVAAGFRVYAPDRPGCGLTDPFDYRGTDLRAHGVAFIASLLDTLGLDRVPLVGNSMGGYWCLAFALAHPERVSRMVLLGEPAGSARRIGPGFQVLATPGLSALLYATKLKPSAATVRASYTGRLVADVSRVPRQHLDLALAAATMPGARRAWLTMVRAATRRFGPSPLTYALRPELVGLAVPTLFVWGEEDRLGPPELGHEMAALMPDARVQVVPGAGHLPWLDRPAQVADLVTGFLRC